MKYMREEPISCSGIQATSGDLSAKVKFACRVCCAYPYEEGYLRVEVFQGLVLCNMSGQAYFYVTLFL